MSGTNREESEDDSSSEEEVVYSGMIQPPLIHQLRNILTEYPDGGQILKELIQNAEDAGAHLMQIFYDRRQIISDEVINEKKTPFKAYFKGPSLCFFNDALFTENDWTGIKMMYNSIKVFDSSKVGKFGLGFKSVFHITEHPMIISGDQFLIIDPNKDSTKVCQTMKLKRIYRPKSKKIAAVRADCLRAFDGIFGFNESTLELGNFEGTLLRLPLRQRVTELSDVIYEDLKVQELLDSFKEEASVCLLFLKSLVKIEILNHNLLASSPVGSMKEFEVYIGGSNVEEVIRERQTFMQEIKETENNGIARTIDTSYKVTLEVKKESVMSESCTWVVVSGYKGGGMSDKMKELACDKDLSYSPFVGAAIPLTRDEYFIGHIFCFLPLPLQLTSLSGLPIHVNGFLALSQNRRHVKWPTADQVRHSTHQDKPIRWNECLVKEAMSDLYINLIQVLISDSREKGNLPHCVQLVYQALPDVDKVTDNWKIILPPFLRQLRGESFVFTRNNGGKWIRTAEAVFTNSVPEDLRNSIENVLSIYAINWVEVPEHVLKICRSMNTDVLLVSPEYITRLLRTFTTEMDYRGCNSDTKYDLLSYILLYGEARLLDGLYLLPLEDGSFTQFRGGNFDFVYHCSSDEKSLLPSLGDKIVGEIPKEIHVKFSQMVQSEQFKIRYPVEDMAQLLGLCMERNLGDNGKPVLWDPSSETCGERWIQRIWNYILQKLTTTLEEFKCLPLIPVQKAKIDPVLKIYLLKNVVIESSDSSQSHILFPLSFPIILKMHSQQVLPNNVTRCIHAMHGLVLDDLPKYIARHPSIYRHVSKPSPQNVVNFFSEVGSSNVDGVISSFHSLTTLEQRDSLVSFIGNEKIPVSSHRVISHLELFPSNLDYPDYTNIATCNTILLEKFPVKYPERVLLCKTAESNNLAQELGAAVVARESAISVILEKCHEGSFYSSNEKSSFMQYFMAQIAQSEHNSSLMELACKIKFVPTEGGLIRRSNELYNPLESFLKDLFPYQDIFPLRSFAETWSSPLKKLGLKGAGNVTVHDILDIAQDLDTWSRTSEGSDDTGTREKQSIALLGFIAKNEEILNSDLITRIRHLHWILPASRPQDYPKCLPWFSERRNSALSKPVDLYSWNQKCLLGSVALVFEKHVSGEFSSKFGHSNLPTPRHVICQLKVIADLYKETLRVQLLPLISDIFTFLSDNFSDGSLFLAFEGKKIMWQGNGFCNVSNMCCRSRSTDLTLEPFVYPLPPELKNFEKFCISVGCHEEQDANLLLFVQQGLKQKYENDAEFDEGEVNKDLDLIIKLLNRLKTKDNITPDVTVLFPIHTENKKRLELRPSSSCRYCNLEWLKDEASEDGEQFRFVHPDVPHDTAEKLGVPSLTDDLLAETEGIECWGPKEPLTRRLHNLLNEYRDGFSIPKEIVQNADDGGASKVCFLYDERENEDSRSRLIDECMSSCQGPALWAFNNGIFSDSDLENITKVGGATKEDDSSTIGKFGLGFCSVYNLTDVPSFVTGKHVVMFDPHAKYLGKAVRKGNPGLKIDLSKSKNQIMLRRMKNQFQPFNGVFGCDLNVGGSDFFKGTLFRFPLRTQQQADESEICDKPYDRSEMKELIDIFKANAGNLLLFSQNIQNIEFYHLHRKATHPDEKRLLYRAECSEKRSILGTQLQSQTPLDLMSRLMATTDTHTIQKGIQTAKLLTLKVDCDDADEPTVSYWLVSWASGNKECLSMAQNTNLKGALPLGAVGTLLSSVSGDEFEIAPLANAPFGFYKESHIFCYLPMPVVTRLPVHLNGSFALSQDRRQLAFFTEDDKVATGSKWNETMFKDTLSRAYLTLLESVKYIKIDIANYYKIWPLIFQESRNEVDDTLSVSFYQDLTKRTEFKIFPVKDTWLPFDNCLFLDPDLIESDIGEIVFKGILHFELEGSQNVVRVPRAILESILWANMNLDKESKVISAETFFREIFLRNISDAYWNAKERTLLSLYALDNLFEKLRTVLEESQFVPSLSSADLRLPREMVHPEGKVCSLFYPDDGRFIDPRFLDSHGGASFIKEERLTKLETLGLMKDQITGSLLIERAESVENLTQTCSLCALERSKRLLDIMKDTFATSISYDDAENEMNERLRSAKMLPVLQRETTWKFPWFANSLVSNDKQEEERCEQCGLTEKAQTCFESPKSMYLKRCRTLVGTQAPILDENALNPFINLRLLRKLGVRDRDSINPNLVVHHLSILSNSFPSLAGDRSACLKMQELSTDIYRFLQEQFENNSLSEEEQECVTKMKDFQSVYVNGQFWYPRQVALYPPVDCSPLLVGLNTSSLKDNILLLKHLGVEKHFRLEVVTSLLLEYKEKFKDDTDVSDEDISQMCNLIHLLATIMEQKGTPTGYPAQKNIFVPNEHNRLQAIPHLCVDDVSYIKKSKTMTYVHDKISRRDARIIGIKSKARGALYQHSRAFRPFGQRQELTTRIKRILSGYQCDSGILKELIQNADDSKATEIKIVADFTYHRADSVFDESWKTLQGPALLVYNNSSFSQSDLIGIQQLGVGSKGDDPTKTGQYGVGFNAVYHLTDVPTFLTKGDDVEEGETLCVMDPHCRYVPDATQEDPGMQYLGLHDLRESFPDVFGVYYENLFPTGTGTIFRFPLRTREFANSSSLSQNVITKEFINVLFKQFEDEMTNSLLFLNYITRLSLCEVKNGKLEILYAVESEMKRDDAERKDAFVMKWRDSAKMLQNSGHSTCIPTSECAYELTVSSSDRSRQEWIICQTIGFDERMFPEKLKTAYREGLIGMFPRGGIALCKQERKTGRPKKAFCILPLPVNTGLPVHVNGQFALDYEARRNLWTDDKLGFRSEWNIYLMENIIAPAYVSSILIWKERLGLGTSSSVQFEIKSSQKDLRERLLSFHDRFPLHHKLKDNIWVHLVSSFYRHLQKSGVPIFLSCIAKKDCVRISQYPLEISGHKFQIVFNKLQKQIGKTEKDQTKCNKEASFLEKLFKTMNMKLIDTPYLIHESMEKSGVSVDSISPEHVIEFLKSFKSHTSDSCKINGFGDSLANTPFRCTENVKTCLNFIMGASSFEENIEGTPLCVTQNSTLREFSKQTPLFRSQFCELFPRSKPKFLHKDLLSCFETRTKRLAQLKEVQITDLQTLLSENLENLPSSEKMKAWNPGQMSIPNKGWLNSLWKMLSDLTMNVSIPSEGHPKLQPLGNWHLIPVVIGGIPNLYKLLNSKDVLQISSFDGSLKGAIEKLKLPFLDEETCSDKFLLSLVATSRRPTDVLLFLSAHRHEIANQNKSNDQCVELLAYFSDRLNDILDQSEDQKKCLENLRSLPLFVAVHGEHIAVPKKRKVFVLPSGMPSDGIKEWANETETTLLCANENLTALYERLDITRSTFLAVYMTQIFPSWRSIPPGDRLTHLEFIRDKIISKDPIYFTTDEKAFVLSLRKLDFIEVNGTENKTASSFCNNQHAIFKQLCVDSEFPPEPFRRQEWNRFMLIAGMKNDLDSNFFIKLAKRVESEGSSGVTDQLETKAKILVNFFIRSKDFHLDSIVEQVRVISFVPPHKVNQTLQDIHKQPHTNRLVAFRGSAMKCHERLLWSNTPLLPGWVTPGTGREGEQLKKKIGIKDPSLQNVVEHFQNICKALQVKSQKKGIKDSKTIQDVLECNYKFLRDVGLKSDSSRQKINILKEVPIVFLPSPRIFVSCDKVVIGLKKEDEIAGFLFQSPEEYGPFNGVFEALGTQRDGNVTIYAEVLASIKRSVKDKKMHPNEVVAVARAIELFFAKLPKDEKQVHEELKETELYLPSEDNVLLNAASLIYIDSFEIGRKINGSKGLHFLIDFAKLDITTQLSTTVLNRMPKRCRPQILTDQLEKKIVISDSNINPCEEMILLNEFVHSDELIEGVIRLVSTEILFEASKAPLTEKDEANIASNLRQVFFQQVEKIELTFSLKMTELGKEDIPCHYESKSFNGGKQYKIFFVMNEQKGTNTFASKLDSSFTRAIEECTGVTFQRNSKLLLQMLLGYEKPQEFKELLDKNHIRPHTRCTKKESIHPTVGDLVPEDFHHLLDNSFCVFNEGEYVALLTFDGERTEADKMSNRVFIYARIVERMPLEAESETLSIILQKYKIRVRRDQTEIKFAYDLYKFSRDAVDISDSEELVLYERTEEDSGNGTSQRHTGPGSTPRGTRQRGRQFTDDRPLEEILREVRIELKEIWSKITDARERKKICKRLIRKWHPDKNFGNEKKAEEVFKYIRKIIAKLERGEHVPDDDDDIPDEEPNTSSRRNTSFWFDEDFFDDVFRECRRERERWRDYSSRSRSHRPHPSGFSFNDYFERHREYEPNPQPYVAQQWLKQAGRDYKMAEASLDAAESQCGYNWICYMCHQAIEKSLKAGQYKIDAKKVYEGDSLAHNALNFGTDIKELVRQFECIVQNNKTTRYPDSCNISRLPSEVFTAAEAIRALQLAEQILLVISASF